MSKYILLEDVQKILKGKIEGFSDKTVYDAIKNSMYLDTIKDIETEINSLPSIDPQEMIREMIEEINKRMDTERLTDEGLQILESQRFGLRKLLKKLTK